LATLAALPLVARQALRAPRLLVIRATGKTNNVAPPTVEVMPPSGSFLFIAGEPVRAGQMVKMGDDGMVRVVGGGSIGTMTVQVLNADGTAWVRIG
jgi:threonine dehydrogenase-like Zn-dependent dehydrogenase